MNAMHKRPLSASAREGAWGQCPRLSPEGVRAQGRGPGWKAVGLAGFLSVTLHLSALAALAPRDSIEIEGGGGEAVAALGNAFADFVEGAVPASEAQTIEPAEPAPTMAATPVPPPPAPAPAEQAMPAAPALTPHSTPVVALADIPRTDPVAAIQPLSPSADSAPPPAAPLETQRPTEPEVVVEQAQADTPRPRARAEPRPAPTVQAPRQAQTSAPQAAGNAAENARRGAADGQQSAQASQSSTRAGSGAAGNAAASNYPGEVMRRIQRTRQARTSARGRAVVAFSIAPGGALAGASIHQSSGNAELDRIALDHIRRSAPFPPPPAGARSSFSYEFVGR